ncbi:DUF3237 domain-containing protein [Branchiibius cervicis]|uniref:UPF0311 protein ACFQBT_10145 n=1 Tax=Branchiibius cervicis TaxID=908252 RepID=A0ABW2ASP3_9MICO
MSDAAAFPPTLEYVFELRVDVAAPIRIGAPGDDDLHFAAILGGVVRGPRFNGRVLPGGGDWWRTKGDPEDTYLDARYLIEADDGATIEVQNKGHFWLADASFAAEYQARAPIPEAALYYRTSASFTTADYRYDWMNRHVFVGLARPECDVVCIRVFRLC